MPVQWNRSWDVGRRKVLLLAGIALMITTISLSYASEPKVQFQTRFDTREEFYNRFVYFVGNHCGQYSSNACRIQSLPRSH